MLTEKIQAALAAREKETSEIRERINDLAASRKEAAAAVQAALKKKDTDGIVAARQSEEQLDREIEALKMIAAEIANVPPVDRDLFQTEYAEFFAQQMQLLNKAYGDIADQLSKLNTDLYYNYDQAYQQYVAQLKPWQDLAANIGIDRPAEFRSQIFNPAHRDIQRAASKLRVTGGI